MQTAVFEESLLYQLAVAIGPERLVESLNDEEQRELQFLWAAWARPKQLPPPGDWTNWVVLAGRGFGKTRIGAEFIRGRVETGQARRIALVGATSADVRKVMVEGESGILARAHPDFFPTWEPSKRTLTWPNGAQAFTYSAEEPERLRGPQHDLAWCDELAAWKYLETFDMLEFTLRLGLDPRCLITTTPKPIRLLKELLAQQGTAVTRGSTYENARNLAAKFLQKIVRKYAGSRLGRQELDAEILDDVPGALWTLTLLEENRAQMVRDENGVPTGIPAIPDMQRVVIGVDPAVSSEEGSDETGIIAGGLGIDGEGYVLGDYSCKLSPHGWARRAVQAYRTHLADAVVAEVNNGGDMVESTIHAIDPNVHVIKVHASRGKAIRAEPVSALDEQHRIHHVGRFPDLEEQMTTWTPDGYDGSPDRMDARVWVFTELMLKDSVDVV